MLLALPKVRWGTLRMPFERNELWRKRLENPPEGMTGIVAELDGRLVGSADVTRFPARRNHVGGIGMSVHDDFRGRGIGSDLLAALVDISDNWLNLLRVELKVYVDNDPALRLYRKFGFEVEGTFRADAFRDGRYVELVRDGKAARRGSRRVLTPVGGALHDRGKDYVDWRSYERCIKKSLRRRAVPPENRLIFRTQLRQIHSGRTR